MATVVQCLNVFSRMKPSGKLQASRKNSAKFASRTTGRALCCKHNVSGSTDNNIEVILVSGFVKFLILEWKLFLFLYHFISG